jgi:hypothetical protein
VDGKGRVLVSWMSKEKVYWSLSDEAGKRFSQRVAAPEGVDQGSSIVLMNRKCEVFLVWKEDELVKGAIYTQEGKLTREKGTVGRLPGANKPTAFVGPDDTFYLVF